MTDLEDLSVLIEARVGAASRPFILAIDGRSGAGKSTLARSLACRHDAAVIESDDFYAGGIELRDDSAPSRAMACIDWTRQRAVLESVRTMRVCMWRAFDWNAFDGRLCDTPTELLPKPLVILEGVYSARPELADLVDLRLCLAVSHSVRMARLSQREGTLGPWERQWGEAEDFYFDEVMPAHAFDVVVDLSSGCG